MQPSHKTGYLLGIGSNLSPYQNIPHIVDKLLQQFSELNLSRVLHIPPVGMNSQHDFLNMAVFIETDIAQAELKAFCNDLEIQLGRDRSDPASKIKDRPADLDILFHITHNDDFRRPANSITDEYFLYPVIDELLAYLSNRPFRSLQAGVAIALDDLTFGETAATINRNTTTC
jgi:2-amino-4-hydroxy-6-hydroxymethyldihydropteridine diphosphokinase